MNEYFAEFITECTEDLTPDDVLFSFSKFMGKIFSTRQAAIIGIHFAPMPFQALTKSSYSEKITRSLVQKKVTPIPSTIPFFQVKGSNVYPIYNHLGNLTRLFAISHVTDQNENIVKQMAKNMQQFYRIVCTQHAAGFADSNDKSTNFMSNLAHDINSLLTILADTSIENDELTQKLDYMERLNKDMLFYLRDLDYTPVRMNVTRLIHDLLSEMTCLNQVHYNSSIIETDIELCVDSELIAIALNNVVMNSIRAIQLLGNGINIVAEIQNGHPFTGIKHWLLLRIGDNGPGIPEDFIGRVKQPFFTTFKSQGHTGFGLSIAEKIIRTHRGMMEINNLPSSGTEVSITLPLES